MTETTTDTRSIEIELTLDASPERVWKALTDPQELTRWFPLQADVKPGEGGEIHCNWGDGMEGRHGIRIWSPGKHLQTGWFEPDRPVDGEAPDTVFFRDAEIRARLVVDYFLEGRDGRTVLRLVHSGFSAAADWDREFESHHRGWRFELSSLQNYVENHLGKARDVAWVKRTIELPGAEAWARIMGKKALLASGSVNALATGDRYEITTVHEDRFEGRVTVNEPPVQFAGTARNLDHALLRCGIEDCSGKPEAFFWLSTWGDAALADTFRARWNETFDRLFER